jgi:hypothetical protein
VFGHLVRINGGCTSDRTKFYRTCPTVRQTLANTGIMQRLFNLQFCIDRSMWYIMHAKIIIMWDYSNLKVITSLPPGTMIWTNLNLHYIRKPSCRGATIQYLFDSIRFSIQWSRFDDFRFDANLQQQVPNSLSF